jgi:nucleolar protein 16
VPKSRGKKGADTEVTQQLEEYALSGVERAPRTQSKREEEWVQALVEKHGDDYRAMFWDRQLNPMQQSQGDIRKRVRKWRERHKGMEAEA